MYYGGFTDGAVLRSIGRVLLTEFLRRFARELEARGVSGPSAELDETAFYEAWLVLLLRPESLPDALHEALHAIHGMATPEGRALLAGEVASRSGDRDAISEMTNEEVAMRAWMAAPDVVAKRFTESRMVRLSRFAVLEATKNPELLGPAGTELIGNEVALLAGLDAWCAANDRGQETVQVMRHELNGEEWYPIRHGDTFTRATKVERRKFEVLHFRPAKDDVVVYSPATDLLRVNARTKGEVEAYRKAFGRYLKGREDYFQMAALFTLEPLRLQGELALDCSDVALMERVVLTRLQVDLQNDQNQNFTLRGDDLFECSWAGRKGLWIPEGSKLVRGTFEIHVAGLTQVLELHIIPPNTLRLGLNAAVAVVDEWMRKRGFKLGTEVVANQGETNEDLVAVP
jgi:hypothetical protein